MGSASPALAKPKKLSERVDYVKDLGASVERKIIEGAALARSAEGCMRANSATVVPYPSNSESASRVDADRAAGAVTASQASPKSEQ